MNIFPGTVKSRAEFDQQESLADHVRYPEDLFKIQRSLLTKYHVTNPQQFFEGSDFWSVPSDPTNEDADAQGLDQPPYFFVASSPENGQPSFQLTSVLTRLNRPILGAYMTVSSDPTDYGQITVKTIPTNIQRDGPRQAFNPMQQDDRVAESRRNFQGNVDVMFGNLLTLPVGNSGILYVVPMYAQARGEGTYPRLFRVITRYENRVGYAPTTAGALSQVGINPQGAALVPGETTPQPEAPEQTEQPPAGEQQQVTPPATGSTAERDAALQAISEALDALEQAQSAGNFTAYGEALDQLNEAVQRYEALPN
jgi:uncharacterized membrane protein (UPF0182 family)